MSLPRSEVDFDSVPSEELWACVIWEYGRTVSWIHDLLPDYGSPDDIRHKIPALMDPSLPVAVRYLHRMLCEAAEITKDTTTANRMAAGRHEDVVRKVRAIDQIEQMSDGSIDALEKRKILDLVGRLSVSDTVRLANALRRAPSPKLDKWRQRFEAKARVEKYSSPFPLTPWVLLGQEIREAMALVLTEELGTTIDFPHDESEPSPGLYRALQTQSKNRGKKGRNGIAGAAHRFVPGPDLFDISNEVLSMGAEAASAISSLRSDFAVAQGIDAVVFRVNWKARNEDLENLFRQWLKLRPQPFGGYAKGRTHSVSGPAGLELPVKPATALYALAVWRKAQEFGEETGWLKRMVAAYEPKSNGNAYIKFQKTYSRGRKVACRVMEYLFSRLKKP